MFEETELLASAARTVSGEGAAAEIIARQVLASGYDEQLNPDLRVYLSVSAASGTTPTLDVTIVKTINGVDYTLGTFAQKVAAGSEVITVANAPESLKAVFAITGTGPSFTFEVNATR